MFRVEIPRIYTGSTSVYYLGNDINNASNIAMFILFAGDTNLYFKHHDLNTLFKNINFELKKIAVWFIINKLSLTIKKTNYILFHGGNKTSP